MIAWLCGLELEDVSLNILWLIRSSFICHLLLPYRACIVACGTGRASYVSFVVARPGGRLSPLPQQDYPRCIPMHGISSERKSFMWRRWTSFLEHPPQVDSSLWIPWICLWGKQYPLKDPEHSTQSYFIGPSNQKSLVIKSCHWADNNIGYTEYYISRRTLDQANAAD